MRQGHLGDIARVMGDDPRRCRCGSAVSRRLTPRFPWFGHRTLAQVDETARLLALKHAGQRLPHKGDERLDNLLWKAEHNNPPAELPKPPEAA